MRGRSPWGSRNLGSERSRRRLWIPAALVVVALAGSACAAGEDQAEPVTTPTAAGAADQTATTAPPTTSTTTPPSPWPTVPDWAEPAVVYLDAYREALNSGDVDQVFPFLAEDVIWWDGEPGGRLRSGLLDTLTGLLDWAPPARLPGVVFATWGTLEGGIGYSIDWVHEAAFPSAECQGVEPCRRLQDVHLVVGPDGIALHSVRSLVSDLRELGYADHADLERIAARYIEMARRFSSGDTQEAAAMMSDRPVWVDDGEGGLVRIDPREEWAALVESIFTELPDAQLATLTTTDLGFPGEPRPAVFFIPAGSTQRFGEGIIGGVGVYRQTLVPGVSIIVAFEWLEQPEGVVDLVMELQPDALANWTETGEPAPMVTDPALWPQVPQASHRLTGIIEVDDGEVLLYNGSDGLEQLVEWGLGRYVAAGLPAPAPRSIAFPPSVNCVLHAGLAVDTGEGVDLQLCFGDEETCAGAACTQSTTAQSTLLHELGHVWTIQNVDDATRVAFLELRGLDVWSAPGIGRDDLGTEHAAEILAWALLEDETWPARLPHNECSELAEGFRVLTGQEPPRTCPAE